MITQIGKIEPVSVFGEFYNQENASLRLSEERALKVSIASPLSGFGELLTVVPIPVAQVDFVYGINTNLVNTAVTGSGVASAVSGLASCSTGAAGSSSAEISSRRAHVYRPGQGGGARFTALFTTGVAGSVQLAGIGTPSRSDGFFFGFNGATFGIFHIIDGSTTFIASSSWNQDAMDGAGPSGMTLNPTQGNVYSVDYQYLGFGSIFFYVEDGQTGRAVLVHIIEYPNSFSSPSLRQPSLELVWYAENTSNTTDVVVRAASGALFRQGPGRYLGPRYGFDNEVGSVTADANIFTLRNATSLNGIPNRAEIVLRSIAFGSNSGGSTSNMAVLKLVRNAGLTAPTFNPIDGSTADNGVTLTSAQSMISVDVAGTAPTGGRTIYNDTAPVSQRGGGDVTPLEIIIAPGETLSVIGSAGQSVTFGAALTWSEDI